MNAVKSVMVVEDDEAVRDSLMTWLRHDGWKVYQASDGRIALEEFRRHPTDLILTDLMMPHLDGIGLLQEIHNHDPEVPVIVLTGYASIERCREALKAGAADFLEKPCQLAELRHVLKRAHERRRQAREVGEIRRSASQQLALTIPAILDRRPAVLDQIAAVATASGYARKRSVIRLAVDEALSNAIIHGAKNDPGREVRIAGQFTPEEAVLTISDDGEGFDLEAVADAPFDDRPGGRGIFLIKSFCDAVEWIDPGNTCRMTFRQTAQRPGDEK